MRVSCLSFGRIEDDRGRQCVLLNAGRLKHYNERILSPVGGGLEYTEEGYQALRGMGAHAFENDKRPELQFLVPKIKVTDVARWFKEQQGREVGVRRELEEELCDETGVLTRGDLKTARIGPPRITTFTGHTRRNTLETLTFYLIEVQRVVFPGSVMDELLKASQVPVEDRWVFFVDDEEVVARRTSDGVVIGDITAKLTG